MAESLDVVIIGAGQAGLSLSHELNHASVEHVVLERGEVGEGWRRRWDSFRLVIPNWSVALPGGQYAGDDPDGFMARDEIVSHLAGYAEGYGAPLRTGVEVGAVAPAESGGFVLRTSDGNFNARRVVLAAGGYQRPNRPAAAAELPPGRVDVIDAEDYRSPGVLSPGGVLVVGSGQTGCQLAEEIHESGRRVHLACGRAPWLPRRMGGRDAVSWILETDFFERTLSDYPDAGVRFVSNPLYTGHHGGRDLNLRTLQALGVELVGRFAGVRDGRAHFADDLLESVAFGDARYADTRALISASCLARSQSAPEMPDPPAFAADPPTTLDLAGIDTVLFTTGFRPDYATWVTPSEAFDRAGFPIQVDGSSTVVPGLHFMGVHFQRKRKSATLFGVAEDAAVLAEHMTAA
jgi:putative flavoprotein involved in K+ transport